MYVLLQAQQAHSVKTDVFNTADSLAYYQMYCSTLIQLDVSDVL